MYSQDWFPSGLTGLNSQQSKGLSRVFSSISSSALSLLYSLTFISVHDYWKSMALTIQTFVSKVMSLILNALSRFVIAFLSKSKQLLISWLTSLSTVIVETKKIKSISTFTFSLSICNEMMRPNDINFFFFNVEFQASFFTLFFHLHREVLYFLFTFCHKDGVICISGEGNGTPLQYSCLENPMDREAW